MSTPEPTVNLPPDLADEMHQALWTIQDWLIHTDDAVLDDLAEYAFAHHPQAQRNDRATELIGAVREYSLLLRRLQPTLP